VKPQNPFVEFRSCQDLILSYKLQGPSKRYLKSYKGLLRDLLSLGHPAECLASGLGYVGSTQFEFQAVWLQTICGLTLGVNINQLFRLPWASYVSEVRSPIYFAFDVRGCKSSSLGALGRSDLAKN
jgi:hypothetical protein